jgi:hypothetical protein
MGFAFSPNKLIRATSAAEAVIRFGQLTLTLRAADFAFGRAQAAFAPNSLDVVFPPCKSVPNSVNCGSPRI